MTREEAQRLWDAAVRDGREQVRDFVFEWIVEAGWDVQDNVVIRPEDRKEGR